jgi:hypothetical protein
VHRLTGVPQPQVHQERTMIQRRAGVAVAQAHPREPIVLQNLAAVLDRRGNHARPISFCAA